MRAYQSAKSHETWIFVWEVISGGIPGVTWRAAKFTDLFETKAMEVDMKVTVGPSHKSCIC